MKYLPVICAAFMLLPSMGLAETAKPSVEWTSSRVAGLDIASDSGHFEYEALEPEAEKTRQPEPIPAGRMQGRRPMISIVIDDVGMDRAHSARALMLPPMVTLALLPYSPDVKAQAAAAQAAGHELVLHLPMQPERRTANPGPDFLSADIPPLVLVERVAKNLDAFKGYVAVNNHMGSRFTKDRDGLNVVMSQLAERNLMFLDSLTSPGSIAEKVAREHGLPSSHRDVFLDNDAHASALIESLAEVEAVAKRTGTAIAIGHPKQATLASLEKWIATLPAKGFDLAPLSQVIALRNMPKEKTPPATIAAVTAAEVTAPVPAPAVLASIPAGEAVPDIEPVSVIALAPPSSPLPAAQPVVTPDPAPVAEKVEAEAAPAPVVSTPSVTLHKVIVEGRTRAVPDDRTAGSIKEIKAVMKPVGQAAPEPVAVEEKAEVLPASPEVKKPEKPHLDSVAKAEAKAREWQEKQAQVQSAQGQ